MRRSKRLNAKNDTNTNELSQFLGIQLIMGIYKFPRIELYWNSHASVSIISQTMTLHRFYQLRMAIHFTKNDDYNTNDRFWKVCPVFEAIRQECFFVNRFLFQFSALKLCCLKASKTVRLFFMLCIFVL